LQTDGRSRRADGRCNSVNPRNCIAQRQRARPRRGRAHIGARHGESVTLGPRATHAGNRPPDGRRGGTPAPAGRGPPARQVASCRRERRRRSGTSTETRATGCPAPTPADICSPRTFAPRTGSSARWASGNPALCNVNSPWRINFSRSPVSDHDLNLTPNPAITLTQPQPKTLTAT